MDYPRETLWGEGGVVSGGRANGIITRVRPDDESSLTTEAAYRQTMEAADARFIAAIENERHNRAQYTPKTIPWKSLSGNDARAISGQGVKHAVLPEPHEHLVRDSRTCFCCGARQGKCEHTGGGE